MSIKEHKERGDTIVEVMVVLAVLGLAIGIAYATANRSLLNARQAQESSNATEIAQSQVEALQSLGCGSGNPVCDPNVPSNPSHQLFHQAHPFCIDTTTNPYQVKPSSDPACTINLLYLIKITYDNNPASHNFKVVVSWDDVLGQGTDTVTMNYRLVE